MRTEPSGTSFKEIYGHISWRSRVNMHGLSDGLIHWQMVHVFLKVPFRHKEYVS